MNDRQLKYILMIAETGNITTAAQKLYISQPSLSFLLSHVEEELGTKIFDRNVSPLALTYVGEYYVEAAKKILSIQRELDNIISDVQVDRRGKLSIGCGTKLSPFFFPLVLPAFMKENPGIQLSLIEDKNSALEKLLDSGSLELAVITQKIDNSNLECVPLFDDEVLLMGPKSFQPADVINKGPHVFPVIDMQLLMDQPFVLLKSSLLRKNANKILEDYNVHPKIILETDNLETCCRMAEEGLAFSFIPYSPLRGSQWDKRLGLYSVDGDYYRHVSIYYRKNTYHPRIMQTFIKLTQEVLNQ